MSKWTADFETTTEPKDCRVWAFAVCSIDEPDNIFIGNSIEQFFEWCARKDENPKLYFHNLKFDGAFIIDYLLKHGFDFVEDKKLRHDNSFTTLITDMNQFYSIEIWFTVKKGRVNKVSIFDSLKIFPNFSVEKVAEGFNLPLKKLELDYKRKREKGHQLSEGEKEYITNDVRIMALALNKMFEQGLTKMTIASDAFNFYKDMTPRFRQKFPVFPPEVDKDMRRCYKGGFTYCNPENQGKITSSGIVIDKNSMYPAMMVQKPLPYGQPETFSGKYQYDPSFPLFMASFSCRFSLKKGKIPSIQIKNSPSFIPNQYLTSSDGDFVKLSLCSPDYELFFENYDFEDIVYHGGWKFRGTTGLFTDYITHWTEAKIKAQKEGNAPMRQIAKLMLNSLYGRFGLSTKAGQKYPLLDEDGIVRYKLLPEEVREPVYLPVAAFITAYARQDIIHSSQKIREYSIRKYGKDLYYYSDTDSIHCGLSPEDLENLKNDLFIDDYALGAWAFEDSFKRAMFLRQKCYIEESEDGHLNVVVAGLPKYLAPLINFDNFKIGFSIDSKIQSKEDLIRMARENGASESELEKIHHKLTYKYVPGGVILTDTDFSIKD